MDFPPSDAPAAVQVQPASALGARDEPRLTETDGLALSAGIGNQYAVVGIQAASCRGPRCALATST